MCVNNRIINSIKYSTYNQFNIILTTVRMKTYSMIPNLHVDCKFNFNVSEQEN